MDRTISGEKNFVERNSILRRRAASDDRFTGNRRVLRRRAVYPRKKVGANPEVTDSLRGDRGMKTILLKRKLRVLFFFFFSCRCPTFLDRSVLLTRRPRFPWMQGFTDDAAPLDNGMRNHSSAP